MVLPLIIGGIVAAFLGWQALQAAAVIVHILALAGGVGAGISAFVYLQRSKPISELLGLDVNSDVELVSYMFFVVPVSYFAWRFIESLIAGASLTIALIAVLAAIAVPYIGLSGVVAVFQFVAQIIASLIGVFVGDN